MKSRWILALVVVAVGVGAVVGNVLATPSQGQTTSILAKATVDDLDLGGRALTTAVGRDGKPHPNGVWLSWIKTHGLSDVYVVYNKFEPKIGTSGWHSHPGPSLIFVVSGTVTNYTTSDPSCSPHVYTAGQSFVDPGGGDMHVLRNEDPVVAAETIAVQFLPQGAVRKTEADVPANCPA